MTCDCITCQCARGEITKEQAIFALQQRREVWMIVLGYLQWDSPTNIKDLDRNTTYAIDSIDLYLESYQKDIKNEQQ